MRRLTRTDILLASLMLLVGVAVVVSVVLAPAGRERDRNPPGMVDQLDFYDTRAALAGGEVKHAAVVTNDGPARVVLADARERSFPREGTWTSPQVQTPYPFTELLPSWNLTAPPDTGASFDVRTRDARTGEWSDWLYVGNWGRTLLGVDRRVRSRRAEVDIDYVVLDRPADAYQVRATLQSFSHDKGVNPSVRRIAVAYSGVVADDELRAQLAAAPPAPHDGAWARDLRVPFRAQGADEIPRPLRGKICSPTSVSMVMHHFGIDRPTVENAMAIYDPDYDLFGNWGRAVARAGELGLDAWLTRFRSWEQVKAQVAAGQPVIASIRFRKGEFPSAVTTQTAGHLLVVRGFTPGGDVIVNDPASKTKGDGAVYKADEFARAWFDKGGVGYVIRPRPGAAAASPLAAHPAPPADRGQ